MTRKMFSFNSTINSWRTICSELSESDVGYSTESSKYFYVYELFPRDREEKQRNKQKTACNDHFSISTVSEI